MSSPFELAMVAADRDIQNVMMSEWLIRGNPYLATYDEGAKMFEGIHTSEESAMNGTARTLTLFRSSGYKPRINDQVERDNKVFFVKSWYYEDDLLIIRLE